jgi:signal transduction histidine kinase
MGFGSISLKTQLLCTIVGSIAASGVALTTLAYRSELASLERDAGRAVRAAAQSRAEAISHLVAGQQQRAERFLVSAASLCGERTSTGRTAWEIGCAQRALRDLRATERALGALLTNGSRRIARSGAVPSEPLAVPTPLARLNTSGREVTYVIRADSNDTAVALEFTLGEIALLLDQPVGLGTNGEMFLRDIPGNFLTPTRFGSAPVPRAVAEWSSTCGVSASDWIDIDYRGLATVHGVHEVHAFGEPVCVEAHVSRAEALAPAGTLLADLRVRAIQLAVVGIVLALAAAHWMSAPVQRLAASARALARGEFSTPIRAGGPSEVKALGAAFAAMARALGEQMAREQRAREEAESANRAKDEFLAVLSHELRTPLTSTLGWARLLHHGAVNSTQAQRAIAAIERSAETQKRLIEDLLDVSRIIAGRLQLDRSPVRLIDPVRAAVEELRPIAQDKGVAIETVYECSAVLHADALRLQQIVTNLLGNAVKFTAGGGRVSVHVREDGGDAEITFADTGAGIAPEFIPHVFEPFRQADAGPRRAYGGLGLGLAIVQHLVKLHGGTIDASSDGPGCGATFRVRLPIRQSDASAVTIQPRTETSRHADAGELRLDNLRILIVEDDEETRRVIAALIEDAGARVDSVGSAAEGRRQLGAHEYSALVSDLAMPHEDGYTFIRTVRRSKPSVPALALTALARREDADAAYEAGFQICLTKPVERERLIRAIAELTLRKSA